MVVLLPVNIAAVLPARREIRVQLDAGKGALAVGYGSDEPHRAVHVSGHIDSIADGETVTGARASRGQRWRHLVVRQD